MSTDLEAKRLRRQADALEAIEEAKLELELAGAKYREAVLAADRAGASPAAIASAAGVSRQRVYQMKKEAENG